MKDSILALDEATGRTALAEKLADLPGMTTEKAKELLAAAPETSSGSPAGMQAVFDQFMQTHSPSAVTGGNGSADSEAEMLARMP